MNQNEITEKIAAMEPPFVSCYSLPAMKTAKLSYYPKQMR